MFPVFRLVDTGSGVGTDGGTTTQQTRTSRPFPWAWLTVAASAIYLYLNLFAPPGTPFLLGGDQVYFWMYAQRLLGGDVVYRDFFQYTPPGTDLVYALFFRVLGLRAWVPNLVVLLLGVAYAAVCFSLARRLMKPGMAALSTCVFIVLVYGKALNATNHWFAVLVVLMAVSVCMDAVSTSRLLLAGALLGLAAFFNQAHGAAALVGLLVSLLVGGVGAHGPVSESVSESWKTRGRLAGKTLGSLVLSFAVTLLLLHAYFLRTAGLKNVWYCQVTYVFHYVQRNGSPLWAYGGGLELHRMLEYASQLLMYLLLPATYGAVLWRCWVARKQEQPEYARARLLAIVGLAMMSEVGLSLNWLRWFGVSLPGVVLALWILAPYLYRRRLAVTALAAGVCVVALHQVAGKHTALSARSETPGGELATTPQMNGKLHWLAEHTRPGDYFLQAGWPGVYTILHVRNPLYVEVLDRSHDPGVERIVREVTASKVRYVLWTAALDRGCSFSTCNDSASPFRRYLVAFYAPVRTFDDGDTVWQRRETPLD